jgi:hypothetical protein
MVSTIQEFDEKYKDYLEPGHYGLALSNPKAIEYLDTEFQELIKLPGFQYAQIKRKFDWFCFYCNGVPIEKVQEIEQKLKEIYS